MTTSASRPTLTRAIWPLDQLPGMCDRTLTSLKAHGLTTTQDLLACPRPQQQQLAIALKLHPQQLAKWVALADLAQIPAVGTRYCGLVLHAGVSSSAQLAQMPASRLHQQILRLQVALLKRKDQCPNAAEITQWIQQARQLIRLSHH